MGVRQVWASDNRQMCMAYAPLQRSLHLDTPPTLCRGDYWADLIGTNDGDAIEAAERAERLWGRAGTDYLYGSDTRASCLFGGRDADILDVWLGGGAAWGEHGSDQISGGSDSFVGATSQLIEQAPNFQMSWDQALPSAQATALLTNLDKLFSKQITPEQFSDAMNQTIGE